MGDIISAIDQMGGASNGVDMLVDLAQSLQATAVEIAMLVAGYFRNPAWPLMLDLYIAKAERSAVTVSSAATGSGAPHTTGLRWIDRLEAQGFVARAPAASDEALC